MAIWSPKYDARASGAERPITGETHVVGEDITGYVLLQEVPLQETPSSVTLQVAGVTWTEVASDPAPGQYAILYSGRLMGAVIFNALDNGKTISISYKGRGSNAYARDVNKLQTLKLDADGAIPLTGPLKAADGTAAAPSLTFDADQDTGLYRSGANAVGVAVAGAAVALFDATGLTVTGAVVATSFSGNGSALTNLNATNLASGTVASARIAGSYTGITGLGTVTVGVWNATAIANAYIASGLDVAKLTTGTTLPSNVTASSLTSLGNLTALTVTGTSTLAGVTATSLTVTKAGAPITSNNTTTAAAINLHLVIQKNGATKANIGTDASDNLAIFDAAGTAANVTITNAGAVTIRSTVTAAGATLSAALNVTAGGASITGTVTATAFSGDGSSLTALNGTQVTTGTVADARLSTNVPLKNAANIFTNTQAIALAANTTALMVYTTGDTNDRWLVDTGGKMWFGAGNTAHDTNLYRSAADTLKTDDALIVVGVLTASGGVSGNVTGNVTGNASTATALQTARAINGVNFDGTAAITITAAAGTLTGTTLASNVVTSSLTSVGTLTSLTVGGAVFISQAAGTARTLYFQSNGSQRWALVVANDGELGSNQGSSFQFNAFDDGGTFLNTVFSVARVGTGAFSIQRPLNVSGTVTLSTLLADSNLATISTAGKVANSATTATSANTGSAIVARDASGNFSAGTITASLSGNVTGNLTGNVTGNVSGNAGTVTNGVYTTGSYADPAWITSLAGSKISGNISGNAANITAYSINQNLSTTSNVGFNSVVAGAYTLSGVATYINLNRANFGRTHLKWYANTYNSWLTYMSDVSAGSTPGGQTPASGTLVTGWALRNLAEASAGYGWTWEKAAGDGTGNSVVFEISSVDGSFKSFGNGTVAGTLNVIGSLMQNGTQVVYNSGTWGINITGNSATTSQRTFSNVRTDGINRGSYGSISIAGTNGTYAGIDFTDVTTTFMVTRSTQGFYDQSAGLWKWYFTDGVLGGGASVPGSIVTGNISGNAANITAYTINQNVGSSNAPTFAGLTLNTAHLNVANGYGIYDATYGKFFYANVQWWSARSYTTNGGLQLQQSDGTVRAAYYFDTANAGLLNNSGSWVFNWAHGSVAVTFSSTVTSTGFYVSSSREVKKDIAMFDGSALDIINSVAVVQYRYIADDAEQKVGFIAEDTHALLSGTARKHFDHSNAIGLLIKSVQELTAQKAMLEQRIAELERRNG